MDSWSYTSYYSCPNHKRGHWNGRNRLHVQSRLWHFFISIQDCISTGLDNDIETASIWISPDLANSNSQRKLLSYYCGHFDRNNVLELWGGKAGQSSNLFCNMNTKSCSNTLPHNNSFHTTGSWQGWNHSTVLFLSHDCPSYCGRKCISLLRDSRLVIIFICMQSSIAQNTSDNFRHNCSAYSQKFMVNLRENALKAIELMELSELKRM